MFGQLSWVTSISRCAGGFRQPLLVWVVDQIDDSTKEPATTCQGSASCLLQSKKISVSSENKSAHIIPSLTSSEPFITWDYASLARISSGWQLAWESHSRFFWPKSGVSDCTRLAIMCWVLNLLLVGGWTNPFEKYYSSQIGSFPQVAAWEKISTTNNQSRYSRKIGIHDITGITGYLYYVCIYIYTYRPEDVCVWRTNCLKHWKDWFPWGSTDVKQSIQSRWEKKHFTVLQLAPGIQSKIWTKTS